MKPITYWIQNDAIDILVEEYGSQLEKLSEGTRRQFIACLADENCFGREDDDIDQIYPLLQHLTRREKDLLIEAIAASLTQQGNPWVETARKMVAIEAAHKKGIPLPIGMPTADIDA